MKYKKYILRATIIILLFLVYTSCNKKDIEKEIVTIEMQKITGEWVTGEFLLPKGVTIWIRSHEGSYWLYSEFYSPKILDPVFRQNLRAGIIDFKIIE